MVVPGLPVADWLKLFERLDIRLATSSKKKQETTDRLS
jgi:hypothetical protein